MCLQITKSSRKQTYELIKHHRKINQQIIAYKVFKLITTKEKTTKINPEETLTIYPQTIIKSAFQNITINNGLNISDRSPCNNKCKSLSLNKLSWKEKLFNEVYLGCHAFLNKKDADFLQKQLSKECPILDTISGYQYVTMPILIEPKNIVIIGNYDLTPTTPYGKTFMEAFMKDIKDLIQYFCKPNNSIVCTQYYLL